MAKYTLADIRRQFAITEKDALGFCVFILNMEAGDILHTKFVSIQKLDEHRFRIGRSAGIEDLIGELLTSPEIRLRREIFGEMEDGHGPANSQ